jgi:hypothetical protein
VQFKNTLRILLFTKNITVESGNCSNLDSPGSHIIDIRSEKRNFSNTEEIPGDHGLDQYLTHLNNNNLSYYVKDILDYIGGYIVRSIMKKIVCQNCVACRRSIVFDG